MFTTSLRTLTFAALASTLLFTTSCNRKDDTSPADDITTAEDRSEDNIETAISADAKEASAPVDLTATTPTYVTTEADFHAKFGSCATRSYNATTHVLTIDFGTTNCLCADGRYRRGKILVQYTTDVTTRRAGAIVTRDNYFVNDNQHTATRIFTDLGVGSFSIDVPSASIIRANNGGTHSWTANWTFTRTAGFGTPQISDDAYSVTGGAQGTNRNGVSYTTTIQTPLTKSASCPKYYTSGIIGITNSNSKAMTLDYGSGACDNTATVTINGRTKTITLR